MSDPNHDADCPSRDGFYPENCECSHRFPATPPPPSETKLKEAIDELFDAIRAYDETHVPYTDSNPAETKRLGAARSSLESLYREQVEKLEAANQDLETLQDQIASKWDEGFRDGQDLMEAEFSALRSLQLTPRQASALRYITEDTGIPPEELSVEEIADTLEKLRRISSKATSEEL